MISFTIDDKNKIYKLSACGNSIVLSAETCVIVKGIANGIKEQNGCESIDYLLMVRKGIDKLIMGANSDA